MEFQVCDATNGQYYWRIVASNGQVLAHSETYERKQSAIDGAATVKYGAATAPIRDLTRSAARW